jgi:hypothetical protein
MSKAKVTKRPLAKPAPAKARKTPVSSARAAPEKNQGSAVNNKTKTVKRNRWPKGKSGNPHGRPKGAEGKVTKTAREIFTAFIEGNAARVQQLWDRVARNNPAKALAIYAKLAEFVMPKLQRTELSGELNHTTEITVNQNDPVDVMGNYQAMIKGAKLIYYDGPKPETPEQAYQRIIMGGRERRSEQATPQSARDAEFTEPAPDPAPAPSAPKPAPTKERRPENVIVLDQACTLPEHRPIVDSKCGFCRKLWAEAQEAARDEALRAQRAPQVVT